MTYARRGRTRPHLHVYFQLFLLVCALACQREPNRSSDSPIESLVVGGVTCTQPRYYAGLVREGSKISHDFRLVNRSDIARRIASIEKSCSCLNATPARRVLKPGESCNVTIALDMGVSRSIATTSAEVYFEGIEEPLTLELGARVRPHLRIAPAVLDFERVGHSDCRTLLLKVVQSSATAPLLQDVETEIEGVDIEIERVSDSPPHIWEVQVSLSGRRVPGSLDSSVSLVRSDGGSTPIPVRAEAAWGFEVRPTRPVLVLQSDGNTAHVTIRSRDGLPFLIGSVRCVPALFDAKAPMGSEPKVLHQLTLNESDSSDAAEGFGEGMIHVAIQKLGDHGPVDSELEIPISYLAISPSQGASAEEFGNPSAKNTRGDGT